MRTELNELLFSRAGRLEKYLGTEGTKHICPSAEWTGELEVDVVGAGEALGEARGEAGEEVRSQAGMRAMTA